MYRAISSKSNIVAFGTPLLIIFIMIIITKSALFKLNPHMVSFGVTFDLLLTTPFIYYLLIRKKNIPKITIVSFFIAGIAIASVILPPENQHFLSLAKKWILPLVEITVLVFVIYKVNKALHSYRENKALSLDFFTILKHTCQELLPTKVAVALATEIALVYYGFIHWKKLTPRQNEFTYHKDTGTVALLMVIILLVTVEATVTHLLVMMWSSTAAWVLTVLSVYSVIQIFGVLKSITKRPISIENNKLYLYYGVVSEVIIDIKDIASIEASTKTIALDKETRKLSPLGDLESHNIIIRLNKQNVLNGFYGIKKPFKTLVLHVDNRDEFKTLLENTLQQEL
ncbi:hypothetical protein D770_12275 [Flammeovirgaceae bacterium 311]|nr:hypothetical protein D770_12275 [Flammeovirgaceae bacterium 311]